MAKQLKAVTMALLVLAVVTLGLSRAQQPKDKAPKPTVKKSKEVKTEIDAYIRGLTYNPLKVLAVNGEGTTSLEMKEKGGATEKVESDSQKLVICTTKQHSLAKNCEDVAILQPSRGAIFPGSLVKANAELVNGKPQRISALEGKAAKATLSIDLPGLGDRSVIRLANPTDANVQRAISNVTTYWLDKIGKSAAHPKGYTISSRQSLTVTTAYSEKQVALQLGINANSSWASASGNLDLSYDTSSKKKVIYALYKQVFYTVSCDPPKRPSSLMGGKVTLAEVKREMTAAEPPAFVQSVSYGRMLLLRIETSWQHTEAEVKAALEATKASVTVNVETQNKYKAILKDSSISLVSLGGSARAAAQTVDSKDLKQLMDLIKKNSEFTKTNPPQPIAYNVLFLKDNRHATMGYTTDYTSVECKVYNHGFVEFVHKGGYVADFKVNYEQYVKDRTSKWNWEKKEWTWKGGTSGNSKKLILPPGTGKVQASGKAYTFIKVTADLFKDQYDGAPRVTYNVSGTTLDRKVEKTVGQ